jgi:excisionase family DNA binding protein
MENYKKKISKEVEKIELPTIEQYSEINKEIKKYNKLGFLEYGDVLTINEVAACLKVSRMTVQKILDSNKLNHIKIGTVTRVPKYSLFVFLGLIEDTISNDR